jgi:predicted HicB family RNase H-like nuclease
MNKLAYKGYAGKIEISVEDGCLHGQILFIDDLITYEGNTVDEIKAAFKDAVDRYLAYCNESGKPANKPYSGTFNVRVGQDLHRRAVEAAYHRGETLNEFVSQSIKIALDHNIVTRIEHTHNHKVTITAGETPATMTASMEQPHSWESFGATN